MKMNIIWCGMLHGVQCSWSGLLHGDESYMEYDVTWSCMLHAEE